MFSVNDFVKVIDEPIEGKVVAVSKGVITVEYDGLELFYNPSQLLKVSDDGDKVEIIQPKPANNIGIESPALGNIEKRIKKSQSRYFTGIDKLKILPNQAAEIDLHAENLFEFVRDEPVNLLEYQLLVFKAVLSHCKERNIKTLYVIHGVGKHVLKQAVRTHISNETTMRYEDAPLKKYGFGATVVFL